MVFLTFLDRDWNKVIDCFILPCTTSSPSIIRPFSYLSLLFQICIYIYVTIYIIGLYSRPTVLQLSRINVLFLIHIHKAQENCIPEQNMFFSRTVPVTETNLKHRLFFPLQESPQWSVQNIKVKIMAYIFQNHLGDLDKRFLKFKKMFLKLWVQFFYIALKIPVVTS